MAAVAALAVAAAATPPAGAAAGEPAEPGRLAVLEEVIGVLEERGAIELTPRELDYAAIRGMLSTLDPFTTFLEPEAYDELRRKQDRQFFGIGAVVGMRNGLLTVIHPISGSPAALGGLQPGDVIEAIDGESTAGLSQEDAVRRLRGPAETLVRLTIRRLGLVRPLELRIERREVAQASVRHAYMLEPGTGYIEISEFNRGTAAAVADALFALEREGLDRLILDLRNNAGGLLDQAVEVANLFVPEGRVIVSIRGRSGATQETLVALGRYNKFELPLIILVNQGTASAAEILAGAIQDHDLGLLVGAPTWGKGAVQTVYGLSDGSGLILTTTNYLTPSGRSIQRPDRLGQRAESWDLPDSHQPFRTGLGRKVYGSGGIVPDLPAHGKILSPFDLSLLDRSAYLQFAVAYHSRHPDLPADWAPDEAVLQELRDWLVTEGLADAEAIRTALADEETRRFALREIHAELLNVTHGEEAAHRRRARSDRQIRIALDHFHRAAELLEARRARRADSRTGEAPRAPAATNTAAPGEASPPSSL